MSKGGVGGVVAWVVTSGEVSPEPGGGERRKDLVVKMTGFWGCCDAGDVIDGQ